MPTSATTLISLRAVSSEIKFIADYIDDLTGLTASAADKKRITDLLDAAKADLEAASTIARTRIGQDPVIGLENNG